MVLKTNRGTFVMVAAALVGFSYFSALNRVYADSWKSYIYGGGDVGGSVMVKHHALGSQEGQDTGDGRWSDQPDNPLNQWLKIFTEPYGEQLKVDGRGLDSETAYQAKLTTVDKLGSGVSCTNRLRFVFIDGPDQDRLYTVKVHIDAQYTPTGQDFDLVTDIRQVIANGGYIDLPGIVNVPDGVVYGTVDVSCRFLRKPEITDLTLDSTNVTLDALVQPATDVSVRGMNSLLSADSETVANQTVSVTSNNFDQVNVPKTFGYSSTDSQKFYRLDAKPR